MDHCAKFIQAWWRGSKVRREFNISKMKYAVKVIARFNKVIRMKRFIRSIKDHKKIDAGLKI